MKSNYTISFLVQNEYFYYEVGKWFLFCFCSVLLDFYCSFLGWSLLGIQYEGNSFIKQKLLTETFSTYFPYMILQNIFGYAILSFLCCSIIYKDYQGRSYGISIFFMVLLLLLPILHYLMAWEWLIEILVQKPVFYTPTIYSLVAELLLVSMIAIISTQFMYQSVHSKRLKNLFIYKREYVQQLLEVY